MYLLSLHKKSTKQKKFDPLVCIHESGPSTISERIRRGHSAKKPIARGQDVAVLRFIDLRKAFISFRTCHQSPGQSVFLLSHQDLSFLQGRRLQSEEKSSVRNTTYPVALRCHPQNATGFLGSHGRKIKRATAAPSSLRCSRNIESSHGSELWVNGGD